MILILYGMELATFLYLCRRIFFLRRSDSRWRLLSAVIIAVLGFVCARFFPKTIPNTLVLLATVFLLYDAAWYLKACAVLVCSLAVNILSNVCMYLYCITTHTTMIENIPNHIYFDLFSYFCTLGLAFAIKNHVSSGAALFNEISLSGYLLIFFVALSDFFLSNVSGLLFYDTINLTGKYLFVISIVITISFSIFLLSLYFRLQHYHTILKERNIISQKLLDMEEQHYREYRQKNADLRAFRHDYNSHMNVLQKLASQEDWESLKSYVNDLTKIKNQVHYLSTNHPVSDAVVNYFYEHLPENVRFEFEGKFSETLCVNNSDLCVVLSNLLKNAVEAVEKEPSALNPKIYLSLYSDSDYLSVLVENTSSSPVLSGQSLSSAKKDSINHGFGLKNVKNVAQKYGGSLDLKHEDNTFRAICYLRHLEP